MTRGDLVNDIKARVGPGIEVTDIQIAQWINGAYSYMVDEITKVNPNYFAKTATTSVVVINGVGQQEYDLPPDWEKTLMVNIMYAGVWQRALPMPDINYVPIWKRQNTSQGFSPSEPFYYHFGGKIGFMPTPTDTTSNNIELWYVYQPTLLNDGDVPAFPAKYHYLISFGAYADYLDQNDEHAAATNIRQTFEKRVEKMIETMEGSQQEEPRSIQITQGRDLYIDSDNDF